MKAQVYVKFNSGYGRPQAEAGVEEIDQSFFIVYLQRHIHEIKEIVIKPLSGSTQETDEVAASTSTSSGETSKNSLS